MLQKGAFNLHFDDRSSIKIPVLMADQYSKSDPGMIFHDKSNYQTASYSIYVSTGTLIYNLLRDDLLKIEQTSLCAELTSLHPLHNRRKSVQRNLICLRAL